MFKMLTSRYQCRFSIIWSTLVLLQQFQLILILNVAASRSVEAKEAGSDSRHPHRHKHRQHHQQIEENNELHHKLRPVLNALSNFTAKQNERDQSFNDHMQIWLKSCDSDEAKETAAFWEKHLAVYPFLLVFLSIGFYTMKCHNETKHYLHKLVEIIGEDEVIDFIQDLSSEDLQLLQLPGDDEYDPDFNRDDPENQDFKDKEDLIVRNIEHMHVLSDALDHMAGPLARSTSGLEPYIDEVIKEYEAITMLLSDDTGDNTGRRKRNAYPDDYIQSYYKKNLDITPPLKKKMMQSITQTFMLQDHKHEAFDLISRSAINNNTHGGMSLKELVRQKRSAFNDTITQVFFIHNSDYPCLLLTVKAIKDNLYLQMGQFDEENMKSQLWSFDDGALQNAANNLYIDFKNHYHQLRYDKPNISVKTNGQTLTFINSTAGCNIVMKQKEENLQFEEICSGSVSQQSWNFIPFEKARDNFKEVVCLFFIQNIQSCQVLSQHHHNHTKLQPIGSEIATQLWYWDDSFIRNAKTHMYLSSDKKGSGIRVSDKYEALNQRWEHVNHTLISLELNDPLEITANGNDSNRKWNLIQATDKEGIKECMLNKSMFLLRNHHIPCEFLCTSQTNEPPLWLMAIIIAVVVSLIYYTILAIAVCSLCEVKTHKTIILFFLFLGLLLAVASMTLIYIPWFRSQIITVIPWFRSQTITVNFQRFDAKSPSSCLWYEDKSSQLWSVGENSGIIHLDSHLEDKWKFDEGTIKNLGTYCFMESQNNRKIAVSCNDGSTFNKQWEKVEYKNDISFFNAVHCVYVLMQYQSPNEEHDHSTHVPHSSCDVLTTSNNNETLNSQPLTNNELLKQLWYYEGPNLVNIETGEYAPSTSEWLPVELNKFNQDILVSCLFLIKSPTFPCKVLEYDHALKKLSFEYYNLNRISNQLWMMKSNKIANYGSNLFLSTDDTTVSLQNESLSLHQTWKFQGNTLIFKTGNKTCSLETKNDTNSQDIFVSCHNNVQGRTAWETVKYDTNYEYIEDVVCSYFIASHDSPCELVTSDINTGKIFMRPAMEQFLDSQLWTVSGAEIRNVLTGLSLGVSSGNYVQLLNNSSPPVRWNITGSHINTFLPHSKTLEIDTNNGFLTLATQSNNKIQMWNLIELSYGLQNPASLSCIEYDNKQNEYFFIKVNKVKCLLLTSNGKGNRPVFKEFDESILINQLWYWQYGHLINLGSGLSLETNKATGEITLEDIFAYVPSQKYEYKNNSILQSATDITQCGLTIVDESGQLKVKCSKEYRNNQWEIINYEAGLDDISKIVCIYFIQNHVRPYEYLTGYSDGQVLKARPLTDELIDSQMFFVNNNNIVHAKTGLYLTARQSHVILQSDEGTNKYNWTFSIENEHIQLMDIAKYMGINEEHDGNVKLYSYDIGKASEWSFYDINDGSFNTLSDDDLVSNNIELYFIRSQDNPCLLLTGTDLGESPTFEVFNQLKLKHQLWYYNNEHIINAASQLVLMGEQPFDMKYQVKMWHNFAFSDHQQWKIQNDMFTQNQLGKVCHLKPNNEDGIKTIIGNCDHVIYKQWELIKMDDQWEFFDRVTCMFFIKSLKSPCELLTGFGDNHQLRTRPLDADGINNQLWYRDGNHIINAENELALTTVNSILTLRKLSKKDKYQQWIYSNIYISLMYFNSNIGFSSSGKVMTMQNTGESSQQWIFVDKIKALANVEGLLHCESSIRYYIRSEHKHCPLLAHTGANYVGMSKADVAPPESKIWTTMGKHIINEQTGKSLSCHTNSRAFLEIINLSEPRQHWKRDRDQIISLFTSSDTSVATWSGYNINVQPQYWSNSQKWKWYTMEEIAKDDKLLRCTRCYNKKEEKAAEIMGYIPIFGLLYNVFRSVAYAAKDCPKVALSALKDVALDIAMDLAMVLTAGAASAVAMGVKTGIKFGVRAGIKAAFKGVKAMVKVSIKASMKGFKTIMKTGIKKTLKAKLKMSMITMKNTLKSGIKSVKKLPLTLKSLKKITGKGISKLKTKTLKSLNSMAKKYSLVWKNRNSMPALMQTKIKSILSNIPTKMKTRLQKIGVKTKNGFKKLGNKLAKKAENAVKKMDDIKIRNQHLRCKRQTDLSCFLPDKNKIKLTEDIPESEKFKNFVRGSDNTDINKFTKKVINDDNFLKTLKKSNSNQRTSFKNSFKCNNDKVKKKFDDVIGDLRNKNEQTASFKIYQDEKATGMQGSESINILKRNKEIPLDKKGKPLSGKKLGDTQHTEQYLLTSIDEKLLVKTCQGKPCHVYLYTKYSPCVTHGESKAMSCLDTIFNWCKQYYTKLKLQCHIAFDQMYVPNTIVQKKNLKAAVYKIFNPVKSKKANTKAFEEFTPTETFVKNVDSNMEIKPLLNDFKPRLNGFEDKLKDVNNAVKKMNGYNGQESMLELDKWGIQLKTYLDEIDDFKRHSLNVVTKFKNYIQDKFVEKLQGMKELENFSDVLKLKLQKETMDMLKGMKENSKDFLQFYYVGS